ncbi:MAG: hypothetical protein QOJ76_3573 [Acidobacteriota bacterium]|jgi:hypothetical protein|nr:hypothetical protein [Acidobacteriota bacterium]
MTQLFERFEINRVPRWPLLSRLVALSLVLHGLLLVAIVYVPSLRSLLYVAGTVSGLKFVSEDYDPTLIGRRATIIKFEPHEKLYYPTDYFGAPAVAETSAFDPMMVQQAAPPPPPPVYRPRRVRVPRMTAATPQPTPSPEVAKANPTPSPAASPTPDDVQKKAEAELDKVAAENGIKRPPAINTKPFEDIALKGKELVDQGKLDLNSEIDVSVTAELNDDSTLNPETVQYTWHKASDENTAALAQQLVTAFSQSTLLSIMKGAKGVDMSLKLDRENVSVKIMSEFPSDDEAAKMATGYGLLLAIARNKRKGTREGDLYNNLKISPDGKQFVMTLEMPKGAAGKMIADMLAEKAAKAAAQNKS